MPFFVVRAKGPPKARQGGPNSAGFATRAAAEQTAERLFRGQGLVVLAPEDRERAIRLLLDEAGIPVEPRLNTE
jgi:hypothetical protein